MMTNLFSIFDPSTKSLMSLNWVSMFMFMLITPLTINMIMSRMMKLSSSLNNYILSEFSPLSGKTNYALLFISSIFFFTMTNNSLGLIPYVFTATSHMSITLTIALPIWLGFILLGFSANISNTLIHMIPQGTPTILMPFMVIIETISNIIRPMTLSIRLAANMIAGHLLLVLISSAAVHTPLVLYPLLLLGQMGLSLLEMAVSVIQAYVISVLITLYMKESN